MFSACLRLIFVRKFDNDESVMDELDLSQTRRPGEETKSINVDFPAWMVAALDREARRLSVTRQSIIKMWLKVLIYRLIDQNG
jgi:hypothetical protein